MITIVYRFERKPGREMTFDSVIEGIPNASRSEKAIAEMIHRLVNLSLDEFEKGVDAAGIASHQPIPHHLAEQAIEEGKQLLQEYGADDGTDGEAHHG